jgi:hypothetical protein
LRLILTPGETTFSVFSDETRRALPTGAVFAYVSDMSGRNGRYIFDPEYAQKDARSWVVFRGSDSPGGSWDIVYVRPTPKFVNVIESRTIWVTLPGDNAGHKLSEDDAQALFRQLEAIL